MRQIGFLLIVTLQIFSVFGQSMANKTSLKQELHKIYLLDQLYRGELSNLPPRSVRASQLWQQQNRLDSLNRIRVNHILGSIDFLHDSNLDDSAREAAFMVIQHASLHDQEKYLPLFRKAAELQQLQPSLVAKMIDRVRVNKGEKQIYGTQAISIRDPKTGYMTDQYELAPIEDEQHVDQRRAKVGLPPIAEGARELGVNYTPKKKGL